MTLDRKLHSVHETNNFTETYIEILKSKSGCDVLCLPICFRTSEPKNPFKKYEMAIEWIKHLLYYKAEEFVSLNALISATTGLNWKNIVVLDSPFTAEDFRLYNIPLRPIGEKKQGEMWEKRAGKIIFEGCPSLIERAYLRKRLIKFKNSFFVG